MKRRNRESKLADEMRYRRQLRLEREIRSAHQIPFTGVDIGAVVEARYPFREARDYKVRPCVVLGIKGSKVLVRPFTTSKREAERRPLPLVEADAENGLTVDSFLRADRAAIPHHDVLRVRGEAAQLIWPQFES